MPTFDFTSPEGKTYSLTGPDGATPEQAFGLLQQQIGGAQQNGPSLGPNGVPRIQITKFVDRNVEPQTPTNAPDLQAGLERRATQLTSGPAVSPMAQQDISMSNILPAASQGTSPNVPDYKSGIVSNQTFENDDGSILYRDPQTGEVKPTDSKTQVAIRDPADGVIKVFSRSNATNEGPATGIARVLAPGLVSGAPTARPGIAAPLAKSVQPTSQDVIATAKPYYKAFDSAAEATPIAADDASQMVSRVQDALDNAHLPSEVAKQVHDTVGLIGKRGDTTLAQLQYVKRAVGNLFKSPDENIRTGAKVATREIAQMISELNPDAAGSLKTADAIRQTGRGMQQLETSADVASLRTGRAGYGGNAVNNMRSFVEKIAERDANGFKTPFKPDEIQAMRDITLGSKPMNLLREVGSFAPSKGSIAMGVGIASGGVTAALGSAANKLATVLTARQIGQLEQQVARRSPAYAQAVQMATERYTTAQEAFASKPTPATLGAFIATSRQLASGLSRDGIKVTSGDLMRAISGPPKVAAQQNQGDGGDVERQ